MRRIVSWLAALGLVGCGGSSSETPPPIEPGPHVFAPSADDGDPLMPTRPVSKARIQRTFPEDTDVSSVSTWGNGQVAPAGSVPLPPLRSPNQGAAPSADAAPASSAGAPTVPKSPAKASPSAK